ncbi:hypothetical protein, partial [Bradyrhizobium sp. sBnM-33]|uniref:hypothetical protein n=1 Tax=Bradyrhizobium sp. sBnM-33 TaxID=2831780 RepID=UPI001BCE8B2A
NLPMKSPDSKYLIDAPAFSEHHGREWPTNKTTDIYLSAINLLRSPFHTHEAQQVLFWNSGSRDVGGDSDEVGCTRG